MKLFCIEIKKKVYISKKMRRKAAAKVEAKIAAQMQVTILSKFAPGKTSSMNVTVGGESPTRDVDAGESATLLPPSKLISRGSPNQKVDRFAKEHKGIYRVHKKLQTMGTEAQELTRENRSSVR